MGLISIFTIIFHFNRSAFANEVNIYIDTTIVILTR